MSAFQFKATSTKLKNRMWWQNFKVSCYAQNGSSITKVIIYYAHKNFRKTNISNTVISLHLAYQEVRNINLRARKNHLLRKAVTDLFWKTISPEIRITSAFDQSVRL